MASSSLFIFIRAVAVSLMFLMVPRFARATPSLIVSGGILTGAIGVDVGGSLYDVSFVDGTCTSVFGVCDQSHFDFTNELVAYAAAQALQDQVWVDGPAGNFDSHPDLTNGCTDVNECFAIIPYAFTYLYLNYDATVAQNFNPLFPSDYLVGGFSFAPGYDVQPMANVVFATFTPSPVAVPLPPTILLFGAGLLAIFVARRGCKAKGLIRR